jgi:peptide/nickel transport system substrate-binding protein
MELNGRKGSGTVVEEARRGISRDELLRRGVAAGFALAAPGWLARAALASGSAAPKRGGTLRVGVAGGSAADFIDGQISVTQPDQARVVATFETLVTFDKRFRITFDGLAEELSAEKNDASIWTIRVRDGVEFHNGKTLTADDVIYSLRRSVNPKLGLFGTASLTSLDPKRITKLDSRTVRLFLKRKDVTILDGLAQYDAGIVPAGYSPKALEKTHPVGTGPYRLQSFTPGEQSVHARNPNYWRSGQPYLDQVVVVDFPDDTARVNALLGGQIDAATNIPPAQIRVVSGHSGTEVLESPTAQWTPLCMRVDTPPFDDVRVRRAMRLIADREQLVAQALAGHGRVGNDLYAPFDPAYDSALPQRRPDVEQASSLLKAAGREKLSVDLQTTNGALGQNEGAQVFAEQAKAAGVTVRVKPLDSGAFYGSNYLKWPFSTDFWATRNYLTQVETGSLSTAPYNETHWPDTADRRFSALHAEAIQTVDDARRTELVRDMQQLEYSSGGYLIWGFSNFLDGYSTRLHGLTEDDRGALPLNGFGSGYRTIWLA